MSERDLQASGQPHPDEYMHDLNPNFMAGQNVPQNNATNVSVTTAYDIKAAHDHPLLSNLADDELRRIPIIPQGTRLEQGAVYIDLHQQQPQEFKALGNMTAGAHNWYVAKKGVDYPTWNYLIGVHDPARIDDATE